MNKLNETVLPALILVSVLAVIRSGRKGFVNLRREGKEECRVKASGEKMKLEAPRSWVYIPVHWEGKRKLGEW